MERKGLPDLIVETEMGIAEDEDTSLAQEDLSLAREDESSTEEDEPSAQEEEPLAPKEEHHTQEEEPPTQEEEPPAQKIISLSVSPSTRPTLGVDPFYVSYEVNALATGQQIDSHFTFYHSWNRVHSWFDKLSAAHRDILSQTPFYQLASLKPVLIPRALKSSLIKQWRLKTHTFHLPMGEWGISLLNVDIHLRLPSLAREGIIFSSLNPITTDDCLALTGLEVSSSEPFSLEEL